MDLNHIKARSGGPWHTVVIFVYFFYTGHRASFCAPEDSAGINYKRNITVFCNRFGTPLEKSKPAGHMHGRSIEYELLAYQGTTVITQCWLTLLLSEAHRYGSTPLPVFPVLSIEYPELLLSIL